jgi:hypothetical protein
MSLLISSSSDRLSSANPSNGAIASEVKPEIAVSQAVPVVIITIL